MSDKNFKSALTVNPGIDPPPSISPESAKKFKAKRKKLLKAEEYVEGILSGNIILLSQAITLVESSLPEHHILGQQVIEKCLPYSGNSIRIGITGVPGVGKSSFIETLGSTITGSGHKLAVLAIDPSSERSKGSILGDKTRMETLSSDNNAFIRPSPSAGSLGGVARKTRETIILCEAAGFDTIFIETVGVGQSETAVHSMVDFFLLLMLAGAGDELQGIKRGIMEMADMIAITKSDGDNIRKTQVAKVEYESALHLFPPAESGWIPVVSTCSARENLGITEIWRVIQEYLEFTGGNGYFKNRRKDQSKYWMYETINETLRSDFYNSKQIQGVLKDIENKVLTDQLSSFAAAHELMEIYNQRYKKTKS
jgi:LAO/AO transport system kinase